MLQDILPHVYSNDWFSSKPVQGDIIFGYHGNEILTDTSNSFFHYDDIPDGHQFIYLFSIDHTSFFLTDMHDMNTVPHSTNEMRNWNPSWLGYACITAYQLYLWYRDNRYCGRCGAEMQLDDKERALRCTECGNLIYPKIMPAVITAVINDDDQILVTKYAYGSYHNYALVAGYAEIGETIEETVIREVKEETGITVDSLHYYKSQPWSFSGSLLFGFWCRAHGEQKIILQQNELKEAFWADRSNTDIDISDGISLTAEMIHLYMKGENHELQSDSLSDLSTGFLRSTKK
jgi:NAD+ diphosphatase